MKKILRNPVKLDRQLRALGVGPVNVEEFATGLIDALVGMRAEKVALALEKILGEAVGAVAVVIRQRAAETGQRHTEFRAEGDDMPPVFLRAFDLAAEIRVEQQVCELRVTSVSLGDFLQERRADNATTAPDLCNFTEVERPLVFLLRFAHELEALGVGADFRAIERIVHGFNQGGGVAREFFRWAFEDF